MPNSKPKGSKRTITLLSLTLIAFGLLQLSSPVVQNPAKEGEIDLPQAVNSILVRSCYDCHSNESNPKWYDRIAPISYLVAEDVKQARSRFNFSQWQHLPSAQQQVLLWEMVNAIEQNKMPLKRYLIAHPQARVSTAELAILKKYVNTLPGRSKVDTAKIIRQATELSAQGRQQKPISSTGIAYTDEYKNWEVLSATDKFDGGSMRIVYANEIMIKAIKNKEIPFPDGARMAKVVWGKQIRDRDGNIFPGNFQNVQFMVKDRRKYASTEGWGFAKFDGLDLKPFGKDATFAKTCINCHRLLVAEKDFVFNLPASQNHEPGYKSITNTLKVMSSSINDKQGTIAIKYGNGTHFKLMTWKQRPMPNWYGSNMNGQLLSIETVKLSQQRKGTISYRYKLESPQGVKIGHQYADTRERIKFIINKPLSVFP